MKKNLLALTLAISVLFSFLGAFELTLIATDVPEPEIHFSDKKIDGVTSYWYEEMHFYSEDEARAAGVPEGFSGDVLMLRSTDGGNVGITLDIGGGRCIDADSITFRVWCSANTREFRITDNAGKDWIVRVAPEKTEEWIEITVSSDGKNIYSGKSFEDLGDENGFFKPVNMGFRFTDGADTTIYIDSTNFNMKAIDAEPPVIHYQGDTVITTTAGKEFSIDATAYDERDQAYIEPFDYIYSSGAIDENGLLLEGEHTCTVRFFDYRGNKAELVLTLIVLPMDVTAPILSWTTEKIFASAGMRPMLEISATDDYDGEVVATLTWSEGALDSRGRLTVGEHTLTIMATDTTGNETVKIVEVIVTAERPAVG